MFLASLVCSSMVSFGLVWFRTEWNCLVLRSLLKSCIVLNGIGHGKSNMVFYGMYDLVWSYLV